jgi:hypothetical protein
MLINSCSRPIASNVTSSCSLILHRWFLLLMVGMACCLAPAMAQPVKGTVYKDFLPMGSGASVALPEGIWELTKVGALTYAGVLSDGYPRRVSSGERWETFTLMNKQADAKVPYLVVRQTLNSGQWGNTGCLSKQTNQFMVNEHGTNISGVLNKCSRMFAIGNLSNWKNTNVLTNDNDKKWWSDALEGLIDIDAKKISGVILNELTVQQFNGKKLRIEAFVLPPKGVAAEKFRDDFKKGIMMPEHEILSGWSAIYIESMQQSFFNKKPQAIMALAYPVSGTLPSQSTASASNLASAATDAEDEELKKLHDQRTQEILREMASSARPVSNPVAPSAVATAAVTKPVPQPTLATPSSQDKSAQQRLEQERRDMEEDKRKMAQQLEIMTQMLAKLQLENATAAAAAKAKELAAAKPEPPAQPKEPVRYANRKALVIGNDLYTHVPKLNNAGADAEAMAKSLEAVGYKVFKHLNLDEKKFKQAIRDFRQNLTGGDEVLFFYAGHGVQMGNANYLLPTDVQGDQEDQVKDEAILLQKVLDDLEEKKTKFALAVIDACRDNPFKGKGRSIGGRGLAPTSAATGQMIMFSAGSGQQALDRLGDNDKEKNGLFTRIFVKEMTKPGLSVDRVLRNVRNEVVRLARSVGHEQTPALYDQAIGEFYFKQ